MWGINFLILVVMMSSVAYAGDYGRKSSSSDAYASKIDLEFKLMKEFVKDLPKEIKSAAMSKYVTNNSARNRREMDSPGASMQEYVALTNHLGPKLGIMSNSDKAFLLSTYHYALLFTSKTQAEADDIFVKTVTNTALTDNKQRVDALKMALLK